MKFGPFEIKDLTDEQLLAADAQCEAMLASRNEASSHEKFTKMPFPKVNPAFNDLMTEIKLELNKRNIGN